MSTTTAPTTEPVQDEASAQPVENAPATRWSRFLRPSGVRRRDRRRSIMIHTIQLALLVLILVLWQYVGSTNRTQELTISTPTAVAQWIWEWIQGDRAHGLADLKVTVHEAAVGGFYGIVIGTALAVVMAASKLLRLVATPFIAVLNALPKIALAPLFILIFGSNLESKVYFIAAALFFITFYNVFSGIRSIDPKYLRNARMLGGSWPWLVREVYAPAIVGWVMTGLRLTTAWSLTGAVVVEYLASREGLGWIVAQGQRTLQPDQVIAGTLIVATLAVIADRVVVRVERHFSKWRLS